MNCCAARVACDNLEKGDARPWAEPIQNPSERRDVPMSAAAVAPDWIPKRRYPHVVIPLCPRKK